MEYSNKIFHITSLQLYHQFAENAPECLNFTCYDDLEDLHGLVLVRGEFDVNAVVCVPIISCWVLRKITDLIKFYLLQNIKEAHLLLLQCYFYYAQPTVTRLSLLERFNKSPNNVDHNELIEEYKKLEQEQEALFTGKYELVIED